MTYANVMSSIAVFVALGGGAYAATGGLVSSSGAIKGCVSKRGGALRVVKPSKKCPKGTSTLAFSQKGPQGLQGSTGATGATGAAGAAGARGLEGISGQTRWGNVLIAEGGGDKVVATVGPFTLTAHCSVTGEGSYLLTTSTTGDWVYGEDSGEEEMTPGSGVEVASDEDYDEAFYAWSPESGVSLNGVPVHWNKTHGSANSCEFQGEVTQTS